MGGSFGAQWRFGPTGPGPAMPDDDGGQACWREGLAKIWVMDNMWDLEGYIRTV